MNFKITLNIRRSIAFNLKMNNWNFLDLDNLKTYYAHHQQEEQEDQSDLGMPLLTKKDLDVLLLLERLCASYLVPQARTSFLQLYQVRVPLIQQQRQPQLITITISNIIIVNRFSPFNPPRTWWQLPLCLWPPSESHPLHEGQPHLLTFNYHLSIHQIDF